MPKKQSDTPSNGKLAERAWKGGGKIARRARSFKQEIVGKINQLRSPGNLRYGGKQAGLNPKEILNSSSNDDPRPQHNDSGHRDGQSISRDQRDVQNACGYFKDCVAKNILDMVPGSASVVLETVIHLLQLLEKEFANHDSTVLQSRTNKVHACLADLMEWSDNVMLRREEASVDAAQRILSSLQDSLQSLVDYYDKDSSNRRQARPHTANGLTHSKSECANISVNSLPDIPLTAREREILSATGGHGISSSTDDILTPPPKPPLPFASLDSIDAPPLPPKRRATKSFLEAPSFSSSFGDWLSPLSSPLSQSRASSVDCIDHSEDDLWGSLPHKPFSEGPKLSYTFSSVETTVRRTSTTTKLCRSDSIEHLISHELDESGATFSSFTTSQNGQSHTKNAVSAYRRAENLEDVPPALPAKQRRASGERLPRVPSQYDNVLPPLDAAVAEEIVNKLNSIQLRDEVPPPLPPKRRTIEAYMQTFGPIPVPIEGSVILPVGKQIVSRLAQMEVSWENQSNDGYIVETPPALPPKRRERPTGTSTPVPEHCQTLTIEEMESMTNDIVTPLNSPVIESAVIIELPSEEDSGVVESLPPSKDNTPPSSIATLQESLSNHMDIMECIEVEPHLVFSKTKDDVLRGLKGGPIDALIVYSTKTTDDKGRDFVVQETFLTTYRSFIPAQTLIEKLIARYNSLIQFSSDRIRLKYARNSFSLLVRIVDDLCMSDVTDDLLLSLTVFTHGLLQRGDLSLARALRQKVVEKHVSRQRAQEGALYANLRSVALLRGNTLLSFKSETLAQQMTLLDNELFQKIDIPEVLLYAKHQKEEFSPNLTRFTEHFNNMSYWARSCVLKQPDQRERERCVIKFLKMMKALRRLNNFNSYLALLSALDSAPLRRLDWQRTIVEGLREFSVLIDSSSSFRAYRQAVAETQPPCIPYIGLILQDLTFVHVGNTDNLEEGSGQNINFFKCWQQYNILEPMRKFKKKPYAIRRNDSIVDFFNNFEDYLSEEAMWQVSETIKPRGKR